MVSSSDQPFGPEPPGAPNGDPPVIPGHQLLRRIARGSYGEIWLARTEFGALRAVKIIRRASFTNPKPYDREFAGIQRYEPISREHEGLVDVLQVGRDEAAGFFYYVMELADAAAAYGEDGRSKIEDGKDTGAAPFHSRSSILHPQAYAPLTLAHAIKTRTRLPVSEVIELGIQLARALDFLHSRRLVHRDIKPSNIIFVDGQAKLADVGLVADLDGPQTLVGTEGYIPPEGPGTVQADIYGLGKVLYETATGQDRTDFPDLGMQLAVEPDRGLLELNEVLLKACESQARTRYRSAGEMAADLERILAGESLRSRRVRLRRFKALALAVGSLCCLVFAASVAGVLRSRLRGASLLLSTEFTGGTLDTDVWVAGSADGGNSTNGFRLTSVSQTNGAAELSALVQHEDGSTITASSWLELRRDLRRIAPCRIDIELAGQACRGGLIILMAEGPNASDNPGPGAELAGFGSDEVGITNYWPNQRLRIDVLAGGQAAVFWRDQGRSEQFEVFDLSSPPLARLRFFCHVYSSANMGVGAAEFRIKKVAVHALMPDEMLLGCVKDQLSNLPISDATVIGDSGRKVAISGSNGMFAISMRAARSSKFTVHKTGYAATDDQPLLAHDSKTFVELRLRKEKPGFGDSVEVIKTGKLEIMSISSSGTEPILLAYDSDSLCKLIPLRLIRAGSARQISELPTIRFAKEQLITDFAKCGGRLVGLRNWLGSVFDLDANPPLLLFQLKDPFDGRGLNWPCGAAFDGRLLWFVRKDTINHKFGLYGLDLDRGTIVHDLQGPDQQMSGLAWDGERFWIANEAGWVYAANREASLAQKMVVSDPGRRFPGSYQRLAFGQGHLWGLDRPNHCIRKIQVNK